MSREYAVIPRFSFRLLQIACEILGCADGNELAVGGSRSTLKPFRQIESALRFHVPGGQRCASANQKILPELPSFLS
jgi:hypothetical protein